MTNQIPAVTERNTKKEILEALSVAEALLAKKQEGSFNPAAISEAKVKEETIKNATSVANESKIGEVLNVLQTSLTDLIDSISSNHEAATSELISVQEAIEIKKSELKELFDIEVKAGTLAALIQAHADVTEEQKEEFEAKHTEFKAELDRLDEIEKENRQYIKEAKEEAEADLKKEFQRKREEAEYEFNREKQQRQDELNDELVLKRKIFNDEVVEFKKREESLKQREEMMDQLQEELAQVPQLIENAAKAAAEEAKKKAETSFGFETRAIKASYEADTKILENKVQVLEDSLANERKANEALQVKLESAYASVETVAKASVEGARTENAVNRVLSTMNEGKK